jgi:hypothetical protein
MLREGAKLQRAVEKVLQRGGAHYHLAAAQHQEPAVSLHQQHQQQKQKQQ